MQQCLFRNRKTMKPQAQGTTMDATGSRATVGSIIALAGGVTIALATWSEPLAAQTTGTAVVPFSEFVSDLTFAPADAYVGRSDVSVNRTAAFEEMRQHLLKLYSDVVVARSFQRENKVFDCVPINDQPGVRLRKVKTVATPPPSPPTSVLGERHERGSSVGDLQNLADAPGNTQRCEGDTIPMRRLTLEKLARFESLKSYFAKGPQDAGPVHRNGRSIPPAFSDHSYAHAYQNVTNYGGYSLLGLYRPYVDTSRGQIFSLSQQWYAGGSDAQLQTVEVGWQNYPAKYGTQDPVLFIYWTADNYGSTGCYNLDCAAFVQTNNNWRLGDSFRNYSTVGGPQYEVALGFYLYQGNWWLAVDNDWVGYYPGSLFRGGQLTRYAQSIDYGGETVGTTSWSPMGSGQFASAGWPQAAYHRTILYLDAANAEYEPSLTPSQPFPWCYTITTGSDYFFFGGPGGGNC
jgi:neprosin-like protein